MIIASFIWLLSGVIHVFVGEPNLTVGFLCITMAHLHLALAVICSEEAQ